MKENITSMIQELWNKPESYEKFIADPKTYLIEHGQEVPDSTRVIVHQDSISLRNFVLPTEGTKLLESDDQILNILNRAINDSAFKTELIEKPNTVAAKMGVTVPDDLNIKIFENKPDEMHLVIPLNPSYAELSDADLDVIAGGKKRKLPKDKRCHVGAGAAGAGCGIAAGILAFTGIGAAIAGGASAAGAGATEIGSAAHK